MLLSICVITGEDPSCMSEDAQYPFDLRLPNESSCGWDMLTSPSLQTNVETTEWLQDGKYSNIHQNSREFLSKTKPLTTLEKCVTLVVNFKFHGCACIST